jgi:hypothetical protein
MQRCLRQIATPLPEIGQILASQHKRAVPFRYENAECYWHVNTRVSRPGDFVYADRDIRVGQHLSNSLNISPLIRREAGGTAAIHDNVARVKRYCLVFRVFATLALRLQWIDGSGGSRLLAH